MARMTFKIVGFTRQRSKIVRRRISSKNVSAKAWVWVIVGGLTIYAISVMLPDLSGLWIRSDGAVLRITQKANNVRAVYERITSKQVDFGFSVGDEHFMGTFEGRILKGDVHSHALARYKDVCKEKWSTLAKIKLNLSKNNNILHGQWKRRRISGDTCETIGEMWEPIEYTRLSLIGFFQILFKRG